MRITDVQLFQLSGTWPTDIAPHPVARQGKQLDIYPEFDHDAPGSHKPKPQEIRAIYVEVIADEISGLYGPINESQAFLIDRTLGPFLEGRDAPAIETLHDQMLRLDRHGRAFSSLPSAPWIVLCGTSRAKP